MNTKKINKMGTLIERLKPEFKTLLEEKLQGFPNSMKRIFNALNTKESINDLTIGELVILCVNTGQQIDVLSTFNMFNDQKL
jgi:hypothetical protein